MQPVPFVMYADFEAITEKIDTCQPSNQKSYTTTYQSHRACGFGMIRAILNQLKFIVAGKKKEKKM